MFKGRDTYKSKSGRWVVYFVNIIFQVLPKILAIQIFSFGFVAFFFGPAEVIPSLLWIPFVMVAARAIVYYFWRSSSRTCSIRGSLLFGLSTIYTFNEFDFFSKSTVRHI